MLIYVQNMLKMASIYYQTVPNPGFEIISSHNSQTRFAFIAKTKKTRLCQSGTSSFSKGHFLQSILILV